MTSCNTQGLVNRWLPVFLTLLILLSMVPLALAQQPPMTSGYYFYMGPNTGGLPSFIRFNEDGTYYGSFFGGGVREAGTYSILEQEMTYNLDGGEDGDFSTLADNTQATTSRTVVFKPYGGAQVQHVALDNGKLCDMTLGGMSRHNFLEHQPDYAYDPAVEEQPLAILTYYYDNDIGSSLTLYHDKSFNDFTTAGEEGVWSLEDGLYNLVTTEGASYQLIPGPDGRTAD